MFRLVSSVHLGNMSGLVSLGSVEPQSRLHFCVAMKHLFTSEEMRPSAKTIFFIKQLAYTYRAFKKNESCKAYYVN